MKLYQKETSARFTRVFLRKKRLQNAYAGGDPAQHFQITDDLGPGLAPFAIGGPIGALSGVVVESVKGNRKGVPRGGNFWGRLLGTSVGLF